ncbi:MAG: sensor histidine kinase [Pseudomonadota bacterium]
MTTLSLRLRLTLIILGPLLVITIAVALWAARDAEIRAADHFDRSLLVTALGISRDTAFTGGDALSQDTRDLLRDTSGGPVFYHVYAPDGVFVTGYATPPVPPLVPDREATTFFDAIYQGRPVRAVRFSDWMDVEGLTGDFTFTVWQDLTLRDGFVQSLSRRTYAIVTTLVVAVALIVWFGVRLGLSPLLDLEEAIARRSTLDLTPIRRPIPEEVQGIVGRLNTLFGELSETLRTKDAFISDAAHQLRNPIAGVLALSEAVAAAKTLEETSNRSADLLEAASHAAKLTDDLLVFERARSAIPAGDHAPVDLRAHLSAALLRLDRVAQERGVTLSQSLGGRPVRVRINPTLFEQAITNLVMNAVSHGGPDLTRISVSLTEENGDAVVHVVDDGVGLDPKDFDLALSRFAQVEPSSGSGLGLPIAKAVAEASGGALTLSARRPGLAVELRLPHAQELVS